MSRATAATAILLLILTNLPCYALEAGAAAAVAPIRLISDDATGVALEYQARSENEASLASFNGRKWEIGWVILPPQGNAEVNVLSASFDGNEGDPAAAQNIPADALREVARLGRPVLMRGVRMAPLAIATRIHGEDGSRLSVEKADLLISFTGGEGVAEATFIPRKLASHWRGLIESIALNPESPHLPRRDLAPSHSAKMLIIKPESLTDQRTLDSLNVFISWKRRLGLDVTVRTIDAVETPSADLREIIAEGYPEDPYDYVILVGWDRNYDEFRGDDQLLFPGFATAERDTVGGDMLFATLDGEDDWAPDVAIGRFMSQTPAKLRGALNRSIKYERNPFPGPDGHEGEWFSHAYITSDHADTITAIPASDRERGLWALLNLQRIGMTVDTFFTDQESAATTQRQMLIRDGVSLAVADGYLLGSAYLDDYDDIALTAGKNPLVVSDGRYYGKPMVYRFFNATASAAPHGPIACISSFWWQNDGRDVSLNGGVLRGVVHWDQRRVADLFFSGVAGVLQNLALIATLPDSSQEAELTVLRKYVRLLTVVGDPSVQIYTRNPGTFSLNLPPTLAYGATSLRLRVTDAGGADVPGATVCIRQPGIFQYVAATNADGEVAFTIPEGLAEGALHATVSKAEFKALLDTALVEIQDVNLLISEARIDDANGDNDGTLRNGETAPLLATVMNEGGDDASNLTAQLNTDSPFIRFSRNEVRVDNIDGGGGSGSFAEEVSITLDADCPGGTAIRIEINLTDGERVWNGAMEVISAGPRFELFADGLGPENLGRNRRGTLNPRLYNRGDLNGAAMNATLVSRSRGITVSRANAQYGAIAAEESATPNQPFEIVVDSLYIPGKEGEFELRLAQDGGDANYAIRFSLPIGEPTENDPVGPDEYGYLCFDSGDVSWLQAPAFDWIEINPEQVGYRFEGTKLNLRDYEQYQDRLAEASGASGIVDLPFDFKFYGEEFSRLVVCTNGWVSFDTNAVDFRGPRGRSFPGFGGPDAQIALCWQDIYNFSDDWDGIFTYYDESSRKLIVEWTGYDIIGLDEVYVPVDFQLQLLDPRAYPTRSRDGEIIIMYKRFNLNRGVLTEHPYPSIGIRSPDGRTGLQYTHWGEFAPGAAQIRDNFALKFTTGEIPQGGPVTGRIVSAGANPRGVAGATVYHPKNVSVTSAADGGFRFFAAPGQYDTVRFEKRYWNGFTAQFQVVNGEAVNLGDLTMTKPEFEPPEAIQFELSPDTINIGRERIALRNRGTGRLDYRTAIVNFDGSLANGRLIRTDSLGVRLQSRIVSGPAYHGDSIYVAYRGQGANYILALSKDGAMGSVTPQPRLPDAGVGFVFLTSDGEHLWGSLKDSEDSVVFVEIDLTGRLLRSFTPPQFGKEIYSPIAASPERNSLYAAQDERGIYEFSMAVDSLGAVLNHWEIDLVGRNTCYTGLGWNPGDLAGMPLYVMNWGGTEDTVYTRQLIRLDPETGEWAFWAYLNGVRDRPIRGLAIVPDYTTKQVALVGVDDHAPRQGDSYGDNLRFFDLGPNLSFLVDGPPPETGSVDGGGVGEILMRFSAAGWAQDTVQFGVKIYHNAEGDSALVPVTMIIREGAGAGDWDEPLPFDFGISSAYPNPFNSSLTVRYSAEVGTVVKLAVYDVAGRETATLFEGESGGRHQTVWRADELPSGVYIIRLEAEGRVSQVKVALIR